MDMSAWINSVRQLSFTVGLLGKDVKRSREGEDSQKGLRDEQRLGRGQDGVWIRLPNIGHISVQLKLVPVWVEDIETVRDGMICRSDDGHAFCFKFVIGVEKIFGRITDLEPNMVQARLWMMAIMRSATNLDQEEFMMGTATAEDCCSTQALQLVKA